MLLRYVVSNFKSIGHPIELSLLLPKASKDDRFCRTITTRKGEWKVLQRCGLFGPNASGKSSLVESMVFAQNYLIKGQRSGKPTGVNQFRGDTKELHDVSTFQWIFYLDNEVYEYGFSMDRKQIHDEWLQQLTADGFVYVYVRKTDDAGMTAIDIAEDSELPFFEEEEVRLVDVLRASFKEEQRNQLFLYKLYDNGISHAKKIFDWFRRQQFIFPQTTVHALSVRLTENKNLRDYLAQRLHQMDTGICDIIVEKNVVDFNEFAEREHLPQRVIDEIEEIRHGILTFKGQYFIFSENDRKRTEVIGLKFVHKLAQRDVHFKLDDESDGTKRLIDLLPMLFSLQENDGGIYFVDEIDRSLHTHLTQQLLTLFIENSADKDQQIFFTSHDVNLINLELFSQNELWFIEKSVQGETRLRPLSDFEITEGQNVLNAYLTGRFGAVPVLRRSYIHG